MAQHKKYSEDIVKVSGILPLSDIAYLRTQAMERKWGERTIHSQGEAIHNVIAKAKAWDALQGHDTELAL